MGLTSCLFAFEHSPAIKGAESAVRQKFSPHQAVYTLTEAAKRLQQMGSEMQKLTLKADVHNRNRCLLAIICCAFAVAATGMAQEPQHPEHTWD
jgi:hypothetical protein